jgi:L-lactate dehydrogenase complex protein LldE
MANTGCVELTRPLAERFLQIFGGYEYVVCPSGSCVSMVRHHYDAYLAGRPGFRGTETQDVELCEFLVDVLGVERIEGRFPHRVGLHNSCHGHRELRLGASSELVIRPFNKVRKLLASIDAIQLTELDRPDECCGFGGTFAVNEEAVSTMMGLDRLRDHEQAGSEVITAADMSCLMHLDGLIRRNGKPLRVMHVAQIFAGTADARFSSAGRVQRNEFHSSAITPKKPPSSPPTSRGFIGTIRRCGLSGPNATGRS